MKQIEKNTVDSKNQLPESEYITYFGNKDASLRIMFVGNSITRVAPVPESGWMTDCGMAASCVANDYVHIVANKVLEKRDACFCICQASKWERAYLNGQAVYDFYENARAFCPDIIIMRIIENCDHKAFDKDAFAKNYPEFVKFLDGGEKAKVIFTSSFWERQGTGDEEIESTAKTFNAPYIYLGDLGEMDEMKALGLFEHTGIAAHPGDLGMKNIAERIWAELEKMI